MVSQLFLQSLDGMVSDLFPQSLDGMVSDLFPQNLDGMVSQLFLQAFDRVIPDLFLQSIKGTAHNTLTFFPFHVLKSSRLLVLNRSYSFCSGR